MLVLVAQYPYSYLDYAYKLLGQRYPLGNIPEIAKRHAVFELQMILHEMVQQYPHLPMILQIEWQKTGLDMTQHGPRVYGTVTINKNSIPDEWLQRPKELKIPWGPQKAPDPPPPSKGYGISGIGAKQLPKKTLRQTARDNAVKPPLIGKKAKFIVNGREVKFGASEVGAMLQKGYVPWKDNNGG